MISKTPEVKRKDKMIKNTNKKIIMKDSDRIFNQVSSKGVTSVWGKEMDQSTGIPDPKRYTGHCWRRTGATCLDEEGISEISLKQAVQ